MSLKLLSMRAYLAIWSLLVLLPSSVFAAPPAPPPPPAPGGDLVRQGRLNLIEPLGADTFINVGPGASMFLNYFNQAVPFIFDVAVGFCAIWVVVGGIQIAISGGGSQKQAGIDHIRWSIIGLLALVFAGTILKTLNSFFYK